MRVSFSLSPNSCIASTTCSYMLKPSLIVRYIYPWMKEFIYGVQAEVCVPLEIEVSNTWGDHRGPV